MDGLRASMFTKLNGDSTLTALLATTTSIYHRRAPNSAAFPFVVYAKQAGTPINFFAGAPIANQVWMVKAVDRSTSASKAEDIDKRLNQLFTDPAMTLTDGTLLYMRRESDIDYEEGGDPDVVIHHVGGLYRTMIDRS